MSLTLLQMIDEVLLRAGMSTETEYADNSDDAVKRLVSLANESVLMLGQHPWSVLRDSYGFTMDTATSYDLPSDFRSLVSDTVFTDSHLEGASIASPSVWRYLNASTGGAGPTVLVRFMAGKMHVYQPQDGEEVSYEYWSDCPVLNGVAKKQRFTADDDTLRLDDELLIKDVLWRYKKLVGLDYQPDLIEAKAYENRLKGMDGGAQTVTPASDHYAASPYYDLWRPVPNS